MGSLIPSSGDLPNPGIKPRSPTLQGDSLPAEPQGNPRMLEWVAYPFSSGSSQPRNQTRVSCIAGHSLPIELSVNRQTHNPTLVKDTLPSVEVLILSKIAGRIHMVEANPSQWQKTCTDFVTEQDPVGPVGRPPSLYPLL